MQAATPSEISLQQDGDTSMEAYYDMAYHFILLTGWLSLYVKFIFTLRQSTSYISLAYVVLPTILTPWSTVLLEKLTSKLCS